MSLGRTVCIDKEESVHAGAQHAVDWLMENDTGGANDSGPTAHPLTSIDEGDVGASGTLPQELYFSTQTAGVAGILRREQQQAATTNR